MKTFLVVNPRSANGQTGKRWAEIGAQVGKALGDFGHGFTQGGMDAARIARQAISTVCEGSGAGVYAEGSPLQRLQRDVEVLKGHVIFDWDRCAELAGRIALGQDPSPLDMV